MFGTQSRRGSTFPKEARILRSGDFRRAYDEGARISGPYFSAFCLEQANAPCARVGFTASRAIGNAVRRNRAKRRLREAVRRSLINVGPRWQIVFNLRRSAVEAPFVDLQREVDRVFEKCQQSSSAA